MANNLNFLRSPVSALFSCEQAVYSDNKLERALEYLELAYDGSTEAEAQVRGRLDMKLGLVQGFAEEDGRIIRGNSVSRGKEKVLV